MKISRRPFYFFVALLFLVGIGLSVHRHTHFGVPWFPGEKQKVWSIESKIVFEALGKPVKVSFALPETRFTKITIKSV